MTTVCRDCGTPQRPGRRCRACAGITDAPARVSVPVVGAPAPVVLAETRYRELRAAGDWPTDWPLPAYPGNPRPHREEPPCPTSS